MRQRPARNHSGRSSHESSKATGTPHGMSIAAGLRTSGRGPTDSADSYYMPLPDPEGGTPRESVPRHDSFPVTAAGQLRIHTGFPINPADVPGTAMAHKILCLPRSVNRDTRFSARRVRALTRDIAGDPHALYIITAQRPWKIL